MDKNHRPGIRAANIGDTDLAAVARSHPEAAREIARLVALMNRGRETTAEFLRLCQLLFEVGSVAASEILLRRNLDCDEGLVLYTRLFGTEKQEEFAAAVEAFRCQFQLDLAPIAQNSFLISTFHSVGGCPRSDAFALLSDRCEVKFGYIEPAMIEAAVTRLDAGRVNLGCDDCLLLFFVNGVWEVADGLES